MNYNWEHKLSRLNAGLAPAPTWSENWTLASILALLKRQVHFFYGGSKGNWTLESQGCKSTKIQLYMVSHPPMSLRKFFFWRYHKKPSPTSNQKGRRELPTENRITVLKLSTRPPFHIRACQGVQQNKGDFPINQNILREGQWYSGHDDFFSPCYLLIHGKDKQCYVLTKTRKDLIHEVNLHSPFLSPLSLPPSVISDLSFLPSWHLPPWMWGKQCILPVSKESSLVFPLKVQLPLSNENLATNN